MVLMSHSSPQGLSSLVNLAGSKSFGCCNVASCGVIGSSGMCMMSPLTTDADEVLLVRSDKLKIRHICRKRCFLLSTLAWNR